MCWENRSLQGIRHNSNENTIQKKKKRLQSVLNIQR